LLKDGEKYEITSYQKVHVTFKYHYKYIHIERHILDNNLYMLTMYRDYITTQICLWLTTKYAYFRRRRLNCILR
jgi:hypothetical protein